MNITAQYMENGDIIASFDGDTSKMFPDDMSNPYRRKLAQWESEGNTIKPKPASPPATDTLINRVQFKSMLALLGKSIDDVMAAIDAVITDPTQKTIAKVKVTDSDRYARNNELFTILGPSMNLTDAEIDTAWEQAVKI